MCPVVWRDLFDYFKDRVITVGFHDNHGIEFSPKASNCFLSVIQVMKYTKQECEVGATSINVIDAPDFKGYRFRQVRRQVAASRIDRCLSRFYGTNTRRLQGFSYLPSRCPVATTYIGDMNIRPKFVPNDSHSFAYLSA